MKIALMSGRYKHVVEGYSVAINYIIKPFNYAVISQLLSEVFLDTTSEDFILLSTNDGIYRIPLSEILYIESVGHYIHIQIKDKVIKQHATLKSIQQLIKSSQIIKCHRAFLVNLNHIRVIKDNEIMLSSGKSIPVSRRERKKVMDELLTLGHDYE